MTKKELSEIIGVTPKTITSLINKNFGEDFDVEKITDKEIERLKVISLKNKARITSKNKTLEENNKTLDLSKIVDLNKDEFNIDWNTVSPEHCEILLLRYDAKKKFMDARKKEIEIEELEKTLIKKEKVEEDLSNCISVVTSLLSQLSDLPIMFLSDQDDIDKMSSAIDNKLQEILNDTLHKELKKYI